MKKVKSSHISSIDHDPKTNVLKITFSNGSVYHFSGVDSKAHQQLMGAESHGEHFIKHIKGKFVTKKK